MKEVPNVGKFEVDADGKVTFTPDKQFKGETPELELTRVDANGTPVTVNYQAVVKEVVPTSTNATSTGPQGVHKQVPQPSKVVIHWFQSMKQLNQPSKMEQREIYSRSRNLRLHQMEL